MWRNIRQSGNNSLCVWCHNCRYLFTYTRNTPFEDRTLSPDEIVLVFVLHVDTLLSIHQIAQLFDPVYNIIHTTLREGEGAFERGGSGDRGRSRWEGSSGDTLRIIGASRDALRVIRAKRGAQPEELKPALDEVEILSEKLDEVWHDRWRGDAPFAYENK